MAFTMGHPLVAGALRTASLATLLLGVFAVGAGTVRLLPWLFDPAVPWRVAAPFARGLASLAVEAAVVVGWPVGWALAANRLVESGEARVLQTLGERPSRSVRRLLPQAVLFAGLLVAVAFTWGRDASEPGRVVNELLAQAKTSCAKVQAPRSYSIPFTDLAWVCTPGGTPRLVGRGPGALSAVTFSAKDARLAGDFRGLDVDDARLLLRREGDGESAGLPVKIHVGELHLRGLAPWSRASTLAPARRAVVFALSGLLAAALAVLAILQRRVRGRLAGIVLGATGPLVALGLARALERADASPLAFDAVPVAAAAGTWACALLVSRLLLLWGAARTPKSL